MSTLFKIRISDVAKDFNVRNKDIMSILAEYAVAPKSPAKILKLGELDVIFNAITLKNQVSDIEKVLNQSAGAVQPEPEAVAKAPAAPAQAQAAKPAAAPAAKPEPTALPGDKQAGKPADAAAREQQKPQQAVKKPEPRPGHAGKPGLRRTRRRTESR